MKISFVSHSDLDGISFMLILKYYRPDILMDDDTVINVLNYGDFERDKVDVDDMITSDQIFFIDFSPTVEVATKLIESGVETYIMDHHYSAMNRLKDLIVGTNIKDMFNMDICGSMIFYNWCKETYSDKPVHTGLDKFINLVNIYDLWQDTSDSFELASDINRLHEKLQKYEDKGINKHLTFIDTMYEMLMEYNDIEFDSYCLEIIHKDRMAEDKIVQESLRKIRIRTDSRNHKFGIILLKTKVSMIARRVLKKHTELDYLLIINTYDENDLGLSVRGSNGFDITTLHEISGHKSSGAMEKMVDKKQMKEYLYKLWTGLKTKEQGYK